MRNCAIYFFLLFIIVPTCIGFWGYEANENHEHIHEDDEDPDITRVVTCGSVIKLRHQSTGYRLHSHQVAYGTGSGQQSVTAVTTQNDNNSLWIIRHPYKTSSSEPTCVQGTVIKNGQVIRLQHLSTKRNLHSHNHKSPLSKQQEVSAFGENGDGDISDNWEVVVTNPEGIWKRGETVWFKHVETKKWLQTHDLKFKQPINGQQEVTCISQQNADTAWSTAEGVYFPVHTPSDTRQEETE